MRISDWSSDVCSSDLRLAQEAEARQNAALSAQITNMNKPPAGYSRNADGTLSPIPGGPADPSIASGRLTANQRVDLENKRGTLRNLASGVTSLRQRSEARRDGKEGDSKVKYRGSADN